MNLYFPKCENPVVRLSRLVLLVLGALRMTSAYQILKNWSMRVVTCEASKVTDKRKRTTSVLSPDRLNLIGAPHLRTALL